MNAHKSPRTVEAAEALYAELQAAGYDVTKNIEWLTNFYLKYNE